MSATITQVVQEVKNTNGFTEHGTKSVDVENALVGDFKWKDVLIPANAGSGRVKWHYQRRTLIQYACLAGTGLYAFHSLENPRLRAIGLGFVFPGAGFVGVGTIPSILALLFTFAAIPLTLFAWFGCGGITFPIVLWSGSSLVAAALARETVFESAGAVVALAAVGLVSYITWNTQAANVQAEQRRVSRNAFLVEAVQKNQFKAVAAEEPGTREVDAESLRFLQWTLELGLSAKDDWSYHDVIDQFQTSAIRYQLYDASYQMSLYQSIYAPNFHGYLSQAQRNVIEKSLTKKVMNFWKWESILGKFKFQDWDPIREDNIMVSGYVLLAIALYQGITGDDRYSKKDSVVFEITENVKYKYDLGRIADAVFRNMDENPYCLYPCEPNWVYTLCNLVGMSGITASDRVLGNKYGDKLKEPFGAALDKEFSNADGTILPIRSELTGFTIPGLAGALSDTANSVFCGSYLPHVAHRHWALLREENITIDKDGKLKVVNLVGADNLDPGNYKSGGGYIHGALATVAAEFGDEEVRKELIRQLDEVYHPPFTTKTGSKRNKGLSTIGHGTTVRARISRHQDWCNMIVSNPPEVTRRGPILDSVAFPDVLVAKAYSRDGESVEMVLYNGKEAGEFELGFTRLKAGSKYRLGKQVVKADAQGRASFKIAINGRTEVKLELAA